jgi:CRP-like cAMP-binding protein
VSPQTAPGKLSPELLCSLQEIRSLITFMNREILIQPGSEPSGIYLVESGEVRILISSRNKPLQLLEVVGPGAVIGLSEAISGERFRLTVQAGSPTVVAFIPRERLLNFLRDHSSFYMEVVRLLSEELDEIYLKFRSVSSHPGRPRRRDREEQMN